MPIHTITAYPNDRLDLIARRAFPADTPAQVNEALRALVWANPDLAPAIPAGTAVVIPDILPVSYARPYQRLTPSTN